MILDGHYSHTRNLDVIQLARTNHVTIISIPPHTSHRLQPLDVAFMGPLKTYYSEEIRKFMSEFQRPVEQCDVVKLFGAAFKLAASYGNSESGFAASGIVPFKPNIFTVADYAEEKERKKRLKLEAKARRLAAAAEAAAEAAKNFEDQQRARQMAAAADAAAAAIMQSVRETNRPRIIQERLQTASSQTTPNAVANPDAAGKTFFP